MLVWLFQRKGTPVLTDKKFTQKQIISVPVLSHHVAADTTHAHHSIYTLSVAMINWKEQLYKRQYWSILKMLLEHSTVT